MFLVAPRTAVATAWLRALSEAGPVIEIYPREPRLFSHTQGNSSRSQLPDPIGHGQHSIERGIHRQDDVRLPLHQSPKPATPAQSARTVPVRVRLFLLPHRVLANIRRAD